MSFLEVEGLHLMLGERRVLNGLSFSVDEGEVYCLVGPNGAGKSTAINVVCNVLPPGDGSVTLGGVRHTEVRSEVLGVAGQEVAVYRDLTCTQNLEFFGAVYGLGRHVRRRRAARYLDAVNLSDRADSVVSELSGGMQRRLHVAAALVHEPPFLILDEPTVGLDVDTRRRIWDLVGDLKRSGRAILLTTHHLEEAELMGSRLGIIESGRIVAEGTLEELRRRIPAAELAFVESADPDGVCSRARELGLEFRSRNDATVLWLRQRTDLRSVADMLRGVPLTSVRLKPVGLEEVFAEVAGGTARNGC